MAARDKAWKLALLALANTAAIAGPAAGSRLNFVSCPIIRDTRTVPCWLSEYDGELYYLTIQSDVSAPVQPPMLGHQVLVEGVVSSKERICGGIVLEPVRLSVMPELDANCRTMLPAEDRYTIDFHPRPPGPSSGRLAFAGPPPGATPARNQPPPQGEQVMDIYFDFDRGVSFRHPDDLMGVLNRARQVGAKRMRIIGYRGAHKLSDGTVLRESASVAQRRADELANLLAGAGLDIPAERGVADALDEADGVDDWQSRRTRVILTP